MVSQSSEAGDEFSLKQLHEHINLRGMNSIMISRFVRSSRLRKPALLCLVTGSGLFFAGCGSYPESTVVSAPPPQAPAPAQQVMVTQPQSGAPVQVVPGTAVQTSSGTIIVTQAPPTAQQEVATARPSSSHVWVPGYWTWRNQRYEWMAGRWDTPPRSGATWASPRWERLSDGTYRFYEGYWN